MTKYNIASYGFCSSMYHTDIVVGNFIGLGVSVCMVGGTLLLGRGTARGLL